MQRFFLIVTVLVLLGRAAPAQEAFSLEGRVSDARTGMPLASAVVCLQGTQFRTLADAAGCFAFSSLPPGRYDLEVTHIGYHKATLAGLVISPGAPAKADVLMEPDPFKLPDLTVRTQSSNKIQMGGSARIISQAQLRSEKPRDLAELLQKEGLADLRSDGSPGGVRTVSLRGSSSDQVLVLLDGRPLNDPSGGSADLSRVSMTEVQQVEVYPQGAAHLGAPSIGGVINIVTLRPGMNTTRMQAAFSGYGEKQGTATLGRNLGVWSTLGIFEHRESSGQYSYRVVPDDGLDVYTRWIGATLTRSGAAYRRDYLSVKADAPGGLELGYRQTALHRQNPDYLPLPTLDHESTTVDHRHEFSANLARGDAWYRPEIRLSAEGYDQTTTNDYGPVYPLLYRHSSLRGEAYDAQVAWHKLQDRREMAFGGGLRWERLWSSDLTSGYASRLHEFGNLQAQGEALRMSNWPMHVNLLSGVRADVYRGENAFVHPSLALEVAGEQELRWSLRGEVAGAYHLPTFNALFWQEDLQSRGNPVLRPERSLNRELSGKFGWKAWDLSAAYFDRIVWDLIYWRLDFDNKWKPLNLYRARIYGAEASLRGRSGNGFGQVELALTHRWTRALNQTGEANTDGNLLPYRPEHTFTISLKQDLRVLSWDGAGRWVSRRYTNEANTQSLSPYWVWDLGLTKMLEFAAGRDQLSLRMEIRNLLNSSYRLVDAAPMPLREWWLTISFERLGM